MRISQCRGKDLISQPGNVCTAGPYIGNLSLFHPYHAAAGYAQGADIKGGKVGLVPAYFAVAHHDAAVLHHGNICGGAAGLQKDAIGQALIHEDTRHTSCQPGQHGKDRPPADFIHRHDSAVAAHDHQGGRNAGALDAGFRHICRFHHLRNQAAIDRCRPRPDAQAIELGHLMPPRGIKPHFPGHLHHKLFVGLIIHPKGFCSHNDFGTSLLQGCKFLPNLSSRS